MSAAVVFGAALVGAAAVWLWPASVHIVSWGEEGPARVGVFAPLVRLWWVLAGALVVAALFYFASSRTVDARRHLAHVTAPLLLLALCAVPFLPWLPDRVPVLLVFDGPLRWAVLVLAVGWSTIRLATRQGWISGTWLVPSRRTVFVVSLAVYLIFGWRSMTSIGPKGDEPHYLVISHSLLVDRDLKIENNHRQRHYRSFTRDELPPAFMQRGRDGEIYSIHAPGLPAILVPAYALAGQYGALAVLCVFGALAAIAVFDLAAILAGPPAATAGWLAVAFTVPFVPYAWSIFPEIAGAAVVAWSAVWLARTPEARKAAWLARGTALALLPWLHTKFVVFLAALAALLVLRLRRQVALAALLLLPSAVSLAGWFLSFYVIYGTPNPEAPYGTYARDWVRLEFAPRGVLGLLLDQKFGLLTYAPVYLLVSVGLVFALREGRVRWIVLTLAAVAAAYAVSSARLYMWWGGWSAPARFLVPALPLVAPLIALAFAGTRATRWHVLPVALLVVSVTIAIAAAAVPERLLLFSDAHGVARMGEAIQGGAPLTATLPMFTESQWHPRDLVPRAYPPQVRRETAVRGRVALIDAWNPDARRAFDYAAARVLTAAEWRRAATITAGLVSGDATPPLPPVAIYPEGDTFWTVGTERARVLVASRGSDTLAIHVQTGPAGGTCRTAVHGDTVDTPLPPGGARRLTFSIPADALWVPVVVQAGRSFRPSDLDPGSRDHRLVGCRVRVETW